MSTVIAVKKNKKQQNRFKNNKKKHSGKTCFYICITMYMYVDVRGCVVD